MSQDHADIPDQSSKFPQESPQEFHSEQPTNPQSPSTNSQPQSSYLEQREPQERSYSSPQDTQTPPNYQNQYNPGITPQTPPNYQNQYNPGITPQTPPNYQNQYNPGMTPQTPPNYQNQFSNSPSGQLPQGLGRIPTKYLIQEINAKLGWIFTGATVIYFISMFLSWISFHDREHFFSDSLYTSKINGFNITLAVVGLILMLAIGAGGAILGTGNNKPGLVFGLTSASGLATICVIITMIRILSLPSTTFLVSDYVAVNLGAGVFIALISTLATTAFGIYLLVDGAKKSK